MKQLFFSLAGLTLFAVVTDVSSADTIDYVYLTSHQFGTMDVQNGAFTNIGPVSTTYEDLTRLPGGTLYGVDSSSNLLVIDQATGSASSVVGNMGNAILGAKLSGSGTLFGYSNTELYTINTSNANASLVGAFGVPAGYYYDATFNGNMMYLQETNGAGGVSNLYTVNTSTGLATLVGNIGYEVFALDFEGSTLYGFTAGGQIVTINTTSGAGTFLAGQQQGSGVVYSDATASAAVPEPATLTLFGIGVTVIAACGWRRSSKACQRSND